MRAKLFSTYLLLIVVSISITGILSLKFTENSYLSMVEDRLIDNAGILREYIIGHSAVEDYDTIAKKHGSSFGIRLTIILPDGTVLGDSYADIATMDKHHTRPEVEAAKKGLIGKSTRYSDTLQTQMMYIALPLEDNEGILRLAMPLNEIQRNIRTQWRNILFTLVIAFGIAAYQGNKFSLNVTKPVLEMVGISEKIARGEFDRRMEVDTKDEMGQLAEAFNTMASKLEQSMGELRDNNLKLEAILSSMLDGIIAVDLNLEIIIINPMAQTLLMLEDDVMGKYLFGVFRNSKLDKMLQEVLHKDIISSMELVMEVKDDKVLKINAAPIKEEGMIMGALVLVQDITELRRLEQIRTDFVANVSHELKTPLTSIKGFVETLQQGAVRDTATADKFLDIINIETDRLSRLINDILSLSELESKRSNILTGKINMTEVIRETLDIMKAHAKNKEITLEHFFSSEYIWIYGNHDRITQMVINLVDNAIKYTPSGGSVTVLLEDLEDKVVLRVKDTGIGIAEKHIPRLFERFYRVDRGRSRNMGGTGLGLAIVKHIVLIMRGHIEVDSEVGKGTEFIIHLPRQ